MRALLTQWILKERRELERHATHAQAEAFERAKFAELDETIRSWLRSPLDDDGDELLARHL